MPKTDNARWMRDRFGAREDKTCGECVNCRIESCHSKKRWRKCGLLDIPSGPAGDIRKGDAACGKFGQGPEVK